MLQKTNGGRPYEPLVDASLWWRQWTIKNSVLVPHLLINIEALSTCKRFRFADVIKPEFLLAMFFIIFFILQQMDCGPLYEVVVYIDLKGRHCLIRCWVLVLPLIYQYWSTCLSTCKAIVRFAGIKAEFSFGANISSISGTCIPHL